MFANGGSRSTPCFYVSKVLMRFNFASGFVIIEIEKIIDIVIFLILSLLSEDQQNVAPSNEINEKINAQQNDDNDMMMGSGAENWYNTVPVSSSALQYLANPHALRTLREYKMILLLHSLYIHIRNN